MPTRHFALSLPHFVLCARTVTPLAAESTMRAFVPLAGVGEPPAINALQHIATIFQKSPSEEAGKNMVSIGAGLPPGPTLWNMAFTGHARVQRCKYCFSLSHQATECEWAPGAKPTGTFPSNSRARSSKPVCKSWNFSNQASCDFRNCNYLHAYLLCTKDPTVTDKGHKIINCPKRQSTRQPARIPQYSPPPPPQMAQPQPQPLHQAQQAQQPQQLFQPAPQPQQYQRFKPY